MIRVGDKVKIVNFGTCYPQYDEWVIKHAPDYIRQYVITTEKETNKHGVYKIISIAPYGPRNKEDICLISNGHDVFLVDKDGLKKSKIQV